MTADHGTAVHHLRLFVAGNTARSRRAIENLHNLCKEHILGEVDLEVIDIYQQPKLARHYQIIAVPTLLRIEPLPVRRIVGDLSQPERVLSALDLERAYAKGGDGA